MTVCTVTGNIRDISNAIKPGAVITFARAAVYGQDGKVVVADPVTATATAGGDLTVSLFPGDYWAAYRGTNGDVSFRIAVPSAASASLADLIVPAPVPISPADVVEVRAIRDDLRDLIAATPISLDALFNNGAVGDWFRAGPGLVWQDRAGTVAATADGHPIRSIRGRANGLFAAVDADPEYYNLRIIDGIWWIEGRSASAGFAVSPTQLTQHRFAGYAGDDHGFFIAGYGENLTGTNDAVFFTGDPQSPVDMTLARQGDMGFWACNLWTHPTGTFAGEWDYGETGLVPTGWEPSSPPPAEPTAFIRMSLARNAGAYRVAISMTQTVAWDQETLTYLDDEYTEDLYRQPYTLGTVFPGPNDPPINTAQIDVQIPANSWSAGSGGPPWRIKLFGQNSSGGHFPDGFRFRTLIFIGQEVATELHQAIRDAM
jgi:hypothetical protein